MRGTGQGLGGTADPTGQLQIVYLGKVRRSPTTKQCLMLSIQHLLKAAVAGGRGYFGHIHAGRPAAQQARARSQACLPCCSESCGRPQLVPAAENAQALQCAA